MPPYTPRPPGTGRKGEEVCLNANNNKKSILWSSIVGGSTDLELGFQKSR